MSNPVPTFWRWFFYGCGGKPGWRRVITWWLPVHFLIGFGLFVTVPISAGKASGVVLIPLASIFVGLTFAWIANVQSVLVSPELRKLAEYREGGFVEYVFPFQLGVLIVLACLAAWGAAGVGLFDLLWGGCPVTLKGEGATNVLTWTWAKMPEALQRCPGFVVTESFLFSLVSFSLRECWRLVTGTMLVLISRHMIAKRGEE